MLLAIDIGNTNTLCGVWDGQQWVATWRRSSDRQTTTDELAGWLKVMFDLMGLPFEIEGAVCASVVPELDRAWSALFPRWLGVELRFLRPDSNIGLRIDVEVPTSVGADRLANCLGALALYQPPIIVIDFGTATTFEAIDTSGAFVGGAILPGLRTSMKALSAAASKLSDVPLEIPARAIGRNTTESLQSGILNTYAGGIDVLATKINAELGGNATIIATGGLAPLFKDLCKTIQQTEPNLTLDGIRLSITNRNAVA